MKIHFVLFNKLKLVVLTILFLSINLNANFEDKTINPNANPSTNPSVKTDYVLEGIEGNSGHIGSGLSLETNSFDYYYSREEHSFSYFNRIDVYNLKLDAFITYYSTDFNRYSFLIKFDFDVSLSKVSYKSFSFGIFDSIYLYNKFSVDLGLTTKFEGNYKFFISTGLSYYLYNGDNYYFILSNSFNFMLNSVNITNSFSLKWMYIF